MERNEIMNERLDKVGIKVFTYNFINNEKPLEEQFENWKKTVKDLYIKDIKFNSYKSTSLQMLVIYSK